MAAALQHDIELRRGATFVLPVRWETTPWLYAAIASISLTAPVAITSAAHTIPDGWNVAVVDAKGLTQLNAKSNPPKASDMRRATVVSATQIQFNEISAAAFSKHQAGTGYLAWLTPHSLDGYKARMQIKDRVGGTVLLELTTENGGIALDDGTKVIEISITAEQAEAFTKTAGVYDLELVSPGGVVTALMEGAVAIDTEVTTPIV
ncbi:hypothetical protein [Acidovorax radicis]|uniref:hypothetical protein n=1 Tax=Acidovorax radicis TaxID=758826 RepID=UPI001CFC33D0|nr:hypothetical protein [Acidovorax radicis]UCV01146.1 hypothetical protein KI609_10735 [Acidovorax radicis]